MERDVVCGMQVDPAKAVWTSQFEGRTYYFCGKGCKAKFDAEPDRYLKLAAGSGQPAVLTTPLARRSSQSEGGNPESRDDDHGGD